MSEEVQDWLSPLVLFSEYGGNWDSYLEAIYGFFTVDFLDSLPVFMGLRVRLRRHPITDGKEATFWHFISEGEVEEDRTPDLRRCERIRWPRPMIEECDSPRIRWWKSTRGTKERFLVSLPDFSYVVVLDDRGEYVLPLTAFHVERTHRREKLRREYEGYKKADAAS